MNNRIVPGTYKASEGKTARGILFKLAVELVHSPSYSTDILINGFVLDFLKTNNFPYIIKSMADLIVSDISYLISIFTIQKKIYIQDNLILLEKEMVRVYLSYIIQINKSRQSRQGFSCTIVGVTDTNGGIDIRKFPQFFGNFPKSKFPAIFLQNFRKFFT